MLLGYNCNDLEVGPDNRYAVVILLPDHLNQMISTVREQFDPDYGVIDSHVSVVFPFRTARSLDDVSRAVRQVTEAVSPIPIELESIGDFYPAFPLIYWTVRRNAAIDELYKSLYAALDLALPHKHFVPHVTVAREISQHRVMLVKEQIIPHLSGESFTAATVDVVAPVANRTWVSVRSFPLAGRAG